jgi:hypothetical protein
MNESTVTSNIDKVNRYLQTLQQLPTACAKFVMQDLVLAMIADLKLASPVDTGNLRGNWWYSDIGDGLKYRIYNQTEYIIDVEYGVTGHPLSDDPEKRKASLRYLFATGILEEHDGIIIYHHQPKSKSAGFIRRTLEEWREKAPEFIRSRIQEWIDRERRRAR